MLQKAKNDILFMRAKDRGQRNRKQRLKFVSKRVPVGRKIVQTKEKATNW